MSNEAATKLNEMNSKLANGLGAIGHNAAGLPQCKVGPRVVSNHKVTAYKVDDTQRWVVESFDMHIEMFSTVEAAAEFIAAKVAA